MSDVNINIRGRDDGLGNQLDNLREKAKTLGRDIDDLNRLSQMTPTEKKLSIKSVSEDSLREQRERIKQEFEAARSANNREFSEAQDDFSSGRITKKAFDEQKNRFSSSNMELNSEMENELLQVEKESSALLREIYKELSTQDKLERERAQRDKEEFNEGKQGGLFGSLASENRNLRAQQAASTDEAEIKQLQDRIDNNNSQMRNLKDTGSDNDYSGFQNGALAAARGDLGGTVMGGMQGMAGMGKLAKGFTIAGLIAMVVKEFIGHGDKIQESIGQSAAMRGFGTGAATNSRLQEIIAVDSRVNDLGLGGEDLAEMMNQKALASRMTGDLTSRTLDDAAFQKGFGADVGVFSQFERFTKNQESSTTIGLDVLNVLTSIQRSNLKEGDLASLGEKLDSQQTIMSLQRQKRDSVDSTNALRVLSAFESIGLSDKGEKGGDFLSQTIQGLGEGGGDNAMLLKYEAARRARPDLANDPAALRRFVRFNSDDPTYMKEALGFLGDVSGGDEMAEDDLIYNLFNPQSEKDMQMYKKAMRGDAGFNRLMSGSGIEDMKERKGTLGKDTMYEDAMKTVGAVTEAMSGFSNFMQQLFIDPSGALNVNVVSDKTKAGKSNTSAIPSNKTRTGK